MHPKAVSIKELALATILVVDDDVTLLTSIGSQLETAGYEVLKAGEIAHAQLLLAEQQPDLIVLEVRTGRDAGWTLLEQFAAQIPILVVSAHSREEDVVRGFEAGATDYISKPYRSSELLARVRARLNPIMRAGNAAPVTLPSLSQTDGDSSSPADPFAPVSAQTPVPTPAVEQSSTHRSTSADKDPVFISETEELALLRSGSDLPSESHETVTDEIPLGQRLNSERLRRRITLVQAESELHIRMWYLQAMEEEKFALLPRGPLAAQMLRSYATYLGLDANKVMEEYQQLHYSAPAEPPASLGSDRLPRPSIPRWAIITMAVVLALIVSAAGIFFFDPTGASALGDNLRNLIIVPTATPTATPTSAPPTTAPTAPATATPTLTPASPPSAPPGNNRAPGAT